MLRVAADSHGHVWTGTLDTRSNADTALLCSVGEESESAPQTAQAYSPVCWFKRVSVAHTSNFGGSALKIKLGGNPDFTGNNSREVVCGLFLFVCFFNHQILTLLSSRLPIQEKSYHVHGCFEEKATPYSAQGSRGTAVLEELCPKIYQLVQPEMDLCYTSKDKPKILQHHLHNHLGARAAPGCCISGSY